MSPRRTICPDDFDEADALRCFQSHLTLLQPDIDAVLEKGLAFFTYDVSAAGWDKVGMQKYAPLLKTLLLKNPTGVFNKKPIEIALLQLSQKHNDFPTKGALDHIRWR